jgi:hypothetical protein
MATTLGENEGPAPSATRASGAKAKSATSSARPRGAGELGDATSPCGLRTGGDRSALEQRAERRGDDEDRDGGEELARGAQKPELAHRADLGEAEGCERGGRGGRGEEHGPRHAAARSEGRIV